MKSTLTTFTSIFFNKRIFIIVLVIISLLGIYHQFGSFLLFSNYEQYQIWFPNHHLFAYRFIWLVKLAAPILLTWIIINYRYQLKSWKTAACHHISVARQSTIDGLYNTLPTQPAKQFILLQVLILLFTLIAYYYIQNLTEHPFPCQLFLSRIYVFMMIGTSLSFMYSYRQYFLQILHRFLFTPTSAFNISIYRIVFFSLLAYIYYTTLQSSLPYIESKPREALPLIGWLIDIMPISKNLYQSVTYTGIACCCFVAIGLFTRFFLLINALLVFYIIAVPNFYGKLWHSQLPIWISWFLLLAKLNGKFALDNLLFSKTRNDTLSPNHTFPIRIIWLQIGMIYFWAGFHKLWQSGFDWALGPSMINQVRLEWFEHFDKLPLFRIDLFPSALYAAGMATIIFELLYPFLLFHQRLKYVSILGGIAMHNLIDMIMYIGFKQLQYQYVVFINYEKLFWAGRRYLNKGVPYYTLATDYKINKALVWFCITLLSINFLFGAFRISTFPFSAYPTYTNLVGCSKTHLYFEPVDSDLDMEAIRNLAQASNFRWENFSRIEYQICDTYITLHKTDTLQIKNVWKWWTSGIPELADIDTLDIYAVERSINPDSVNFIISKQYLMRLYPNTNP